VSVGEQNTACVTDDGALFTWGGGMLGPGDVWVPTEVGMMLEF